MVGNTKKKKKNFLRRQPVYFRYSLKYFKSGLGNVEENAKKNIRNIRFTASSKIFYN